MYHVHVLPSVIRQLVSARLPLIDSPTFYLIWCSFVGMPLTRKPSLSEAFCLRVCPSLTESGPPENLVDTTFLKTVKGILGIQIKSNQIIFIGIWQP